MSAKDFAGVTLAFCLKAASGLFLACVSASPAAGPFAPGGAAGCAIVYATLSTTCYASHRAMILSAQDDFKIRIDTANKTFDNFVRGAKEKLEICLRDKP